MKSRRSVLSALILFLLFPALGEVGAGAATTVSNVPPEGFRWIAKLPAAVVGTPALDFDSTMLYVGTHNRRFYALDTETGDTNWILKLPAVPTSSPTVDDDGLIYVGCADGVLYRISVDAEGIPHLSERDGADPPFHPYLGGKIASPAIGDDGTVYAGGTANHLYALRSDSSKLWVHTASNDVATPVIADAAVFVVSGSKVLGLGIDDGVVTSTFNPFVAIHSIPALAGDGTLYFGANDERVYALNAGGTTNIWRFKTSKDVNSSPAVGADGSIYIASDNLLLYRLNINGVVVWKTFTPAPIRSALSLGADGTIYAGCDNGRFYAFSPDDGHILWSVKTRARIRSSAVVDSTGVVYFSSGRTIYAVAQNVGEDIGEPAWQMFRKDRKHTANANTNFFYNPPTISVQPISRAVNEGATASFSVSANGSMPLFYQWYFNSNVISSTVNPTATTQTFTVTNATSTVTGIYYVVVANSVGSVTSAAVSLSVTVTNGPPTITVQPSITTVFSGSDTFFTVGVAGAVPFSYQWRYNSNVINAASNSTAATAMLVLRSVTTNEAGYFDVVVTNVFGATTSAVARLLVIPSLPSASLIAKEQAAQLSIESITLNPNGLVIQVKAAKDWTKMVLEYKEGLSELTWKPLGTNDAGKLEFIDPIPLMDRARFYRVRAQ